MGGSGLSFDGLGAGAVKNGMEVFGILQSSEFVCSCGSVHLSSVNEICGILGNLSALYLDEPSRYDRASGEYGIMGWGPQWEFAAWMRDHACEWRSLSCQVKFMLNANNTDRARSAHAEWISWCEENPYASVEDCCVAWASIVESYEGPYDRRVSYALSWLNWHEGVNGVQSAPPVRARSSAPLRAPSASGWDGTTIVQMPLNSRVTRKEGRTISKLAIHYPAEPHKTARQIGQVFIDRRASADFAVDESEVVQFNPDPRNYYCWAVGDNHSGANPTTISIEICVKIQSGTNEERPNHEGWYFPEVTLQNAAKLARKLMSDYNIPLSNVVRHYDITGKSCPGVVGWNNNNLYTTAGVETRTRNNSNEWENFKRMLAGSQVSGSASTGGGSSMTINNASCDYSALSALDSDTQRNGTIVFQRLLNEPFNDSTGRTHMSTINEICAIIGNFSHENLAHPENFLNTCGRRRVPEYSYGIMGWNDLCSCEPLRIGCGWDFEKWFRDHNLEWKDINNQITFLLTADHSKRRNKGWIDFCTSNPNASVEECSYQWASIQERCDGCTTRRSATNQRRATTANAWLEWYNRNKSAVQSCISGEANTNSVPQTQTATVYSREECLKWGPLYRRRRVTIVQPAQQTQQTQEPSSDIPLGDYVPSSEPRYRAAQSHVGGYPDSREGKKQFIQDMYMSMRAVGLNDTLSRVITAQCCLESAYGHSTLANEASNYGGIREFGNGPSVVVSGKKWKKFQSLGHYSHNKVKLLQQYPGSLQASNGNAYLCNIEGISEDHRSLVRQNHIYCPEDRDRGETWQQTRVGYVEKILRIQDQQVDPVINAMN